jgi:GNAT superfamily N-acetyltransferase
MGCLTMTADDRAMTLLPPKGSIRPKPAVRIWKRCCIAASPKRSSGLSSFPTSSSIRARMIQYRTLVGATATKEEVDTFVELVVAGGAVRENHVRRGAVRPGAQLIFAEVDGQTVGVAALKVPLVRYRSSLQEPAKAGYSLPESEFPYELGYVSVLPKYSGRRIAKKLVEEVLRLASGNGVFATTSNPTMKEGVLPSFKFVPVGKTWSNGSGDILSLFVRKSQTK